MGMTRESAQYFERVAADWDKIRSGYFTEALRDAAIGRAYLRPEMVVADVGAGTGFMAAGLAPLVSRVFALDGSAAMLDVARRNLAAFANVEYQQADGTTLPLDDASVDAVFANMYLHHCPDPAAAVREMVRILRPGGRLVVTDMDRHSHEWMREEMADVWLGFERDQVKSWLRDAGLVNVIVDCSSQSCCAQSGDQARAAAEGHVEIGVFVATGSRRVAGAREAVEANYAAAATGQAGSCCAPESGAVAAPAQDAATSSCCGPAAVASPQAIALTDSPAAAPPGGCCGTTAQAQALFLSDTVTRVAENCCAPPPAPTNAMGQVEASAGIGDEGLFWNTGYTAEQLAAVPADAAAISLGCGNPGALAGLKPGEVVLDIGSGGGIDAFFAARRVGPTGQVIGIDMTPSMIERAQRSAEAAGLSQVEFRLGQAEELPVESGTVDIIMSNCVINLVEDKGKVFEEAFRVLKPGGRISISDMVAEGPLPMSLRSDPQSWAGCVHGALPEAEYLDLLRQAGFGEIQTGRSHSGGRVEGVEVYSLSVTARKAK